MKNVAIMNSKQTKLGIIDVDMVKHIIDADSTLYPDQVDRIDKFITTVEKIKDYHADRFADYEYEIDNCLADLFQTMLSVAYDLRNEATTDVVKSKRAKLLERFNNSLSHIDTVDRLEALETILSIVMSAVTETDTKTLNLKVEFLPADSDKSKAEE